MPDHDTAPDWIDDLLEQAAEHRAQRQARPERERRATAPAALPEDLGDADPPTCPPTRCGAPPWPTTSTSSPSPSPATRSCA